MSARSVHETSAYENATTKSRRHEDHTKKNFINMKEFFFVIFAPS